MGERRFKLCSGQLRNDLLGHQLHRPAHLGLVVPVVGDHQHRAETSGDIVEILNFLRDRVDTALESLREDGTLAEISDKWFGTDITKAE